MAGWGNPDVDRIAALKGDPTPHILNPQTDEVIGGVKTGRMADNPSPKYRYLFPDGTYVDVQTNQDTGERTTLGGTALASAAPKPPAKPRTTKIGNDLYEEQPDGSFAKVIDNPDQPVKPNDTLPTDRMVTIGPEGQQMPERLSPAAYTALVNGERARALQRLDEIKAREAQGQLDHAGADRERQQAKDDLAQRLALAKDKREADAAALARENSALANQRENRLAANDTRRATVDEQKYGMDVQKFGYQAGQDAIANARAASAATLGSGQFGEHLAAFLRGGAGTMPQFTAADLQHQTPDYDAIATAAAQKALASIGYTGPGGGGPSVDAMHGMFGTQPTAAAPAPQAAPPPAAPVPPPAPPQPPQPVVPPALPFPVGGNG